MIPFLSTLPHPLQPEPMLEPLLVGVSDGVGRDGEDACVSGSWKAPSLHTWLG